MSFEKKLFWGVFFCKVLTLLLFIGIFGYGRLLWSDSTHYVKIGTSIFEGKGFSDPTSDGGAIPDTIRVPFYPTVVGFFSKFMPYGLLWVSLLQALAAAGIALVAYRIGRIYLDKHFALGAALLASFEPLISTFHILIMPDTFLVLFLLLWMWFLIKHFETASWRELALSVLFLALAVYTKSIASYLFAITGVVLLVRHRSLQKPVIALALLFLLLAPWMAYNRSRIGTFAMTTDDVGNLCSWELVALISTRHRLDSVDWLPIVNHPEYQNILVRCTSTKNALSVFIREYPKEFITATGISTLSLLTNEGYSTFFEKPADVQIQPHHNYLTPPVLTNRDWPTKVAAAAREMRLYELLAIIAGKLLWIFVSAAAAFGLWKTFRAGSHFFSTLLLLLFMLYIIGVTTVSTGYGVGARLRFPIDPLLAIFAAVGMQAYFRRYTKA